MKSMSDPVKSSDIEDVLSSIRRLVSEDYQRTPEVDAPEAQPETTADEADAPVHGDQALVLTPALRVHDGGKAESTGDEASEPATGAADAPVAQDAVLDAVADALVEEALQQDDETGSPEEAIALAEPEPEESTDETPASRAGTMVAEHIEDEDAGTASADEMSTVAMHDPAPANMDAPAEQATVDAPDEDELSDSEEPEDHSAQDASESLEAKIAALETLIGKRNEEWEPEEGDGSLAADVASEMNDATALDWEDHAPNTEAHESGLEVNESPPAEEQLTEAEVIAEEPVAEPSSKGTDEAILKDEPEGLLIDEETLRDMVCDIVREELQGALGERITRNVRRLVRREIHRALASQELD